jgi:thymidylate synthase
MAKPYLFGDTLDDLMRSVIDEIREQGEHVCTSKGLTSEITGVLLELTNPRARLSKTESRGKLFSCLGQTCWYLAKSNDLAFILHYLKHYKEDADGDLIFGGYGPRLFNWGGLNQIANVIKLLKARNTTRQAVVQLFDANDIAAAHKEIPCTCTLQFMVRHKKLHMFTSMRSNDVLWGLPHDFFFFTILQEIIARDLGIEIGSYKHAVGSLHLYEDKTVDVKSFIEEGWQSTKESMTPMPQGDPWPSISILLEAESSIRITGECDESVLDTIDPYWADLVRLLQVYAHKKGKNSKGILQVREKISSPLYLPFIDKALEDLR